MTKRNKNKEYWRERQIDLQESLFIEAEDYTAEIEKGYNAAIRELERQISVWYQRFADNNGVDMVTAQRMLNNRELEELMWDVNEYIKHGEENALDGKWMKELENASARVHISRFEALKLQTRQCLEQLYGGREQKVRGLLGDTYTGSLYGTGYEHFCRTGIETYFDRIDQRKLNQILNKAWTVDGKNFSERIWDNKQQLINVLNNEFTKAFTTGESPDKTIKAIAKKLDADEKSAKKLVMTESAYFSVKGQKDCYGELDVEEYEVIETLDSITCEECGSYDGKHYPVKSMLPGVNAPPFHPHCRGTTCPYFDDEFTEGEQRAARDEEGKTTYVDDMTFEEWKKKFVDGGDKENIIPIELTEIDLKKQFEELTEGYYSYDDFMKDFSSIEEGFEGSSDAEIKKAKDISERIEALRSELMIDKKASSNATRTKEESTESLKNLGIDFKGDISDETLNKYVNFITNFEIEHAGYFVQNKLKLKSISVVDNIKGVKAGGRYRGKNNSIEIKKSSIKSNQAINSKSDDIELHTLSHEYGHYIADTLERNFGISDADVVQNSINKYFNGDIFKSPKDLKDCLSSYGSTSYGEAFAEAFAEAYTCEKPRKFAQLFKEELENILSDNRKLKSEIVDVVENQVAKSAESGIIKSIDVDDFMDMAEGHDIKREVSEVIANTIRDFENKGGMYISDMHFGSFFDSETGKKALFQIFPNAFGLTEINVNSEILAGRTISDIDEIIGNTVSNLPKNLKEAVVHECGHAKAYYRKTVSEITEMNKILKTEGIKGISVIAEFDGAECIAEVEVLLYRGEKVPEEALKLYNKWTGGKIK